MSVLEGTAPRMHSSLHLPDLRRIASADMPYARCVKAASLQHLTKAAITAEEMMDQLGVVTSPFIPKVGAASLPGDVVAMSGHVLCNP